VTFPLNIVARSWFLQGAPGGWRKRDPGNDAGCGVRVLGNLTFLKLDLNKRARFSRTNHYSKQKRNCHLISTRYLRAFEKCFEQTHLTGESLRVLNGLRPL